MQEEIEISKDKIETEKGLYVYCAAEYSDAVPHTLGNIGIEDNEVFVIASDGVCLIAHACDAKPYASKNEDEVKAWIKAHHNVISTASRIFPAVAPFSFDVIIKGSSDTAVNWLRNERDKILEKLGRIKGREEYVIQILWEKEITKKYVMAKEKFKILENEIKNMPKGKAYLYKQKLEKALEQELEKLAEEYFRFFNDKIKRHSDGIKVERNKDTSMLMNVSCLVSREKVRVLGNELETINNMNEFSVRFVGPFPPYSFV